MDPGSSSHDATVDCEMFLSEYEDDGSRKRHVMPQNAFPFFSGSFDDGQWATAAETIGDGACSLHSLWGSVISTPAGSAYYCEDARHKLCEEMPTDVSVILNSECGTAVRMLLDNIWCDVIASVMRKTRQEPLMPRLCFVSFAEHL